jgi:hypothetical protein
MRIVRRPPVCVLPTYTGALAVKLAVKKGMLFQPVHPYSQVFDLRPRVEPALWGGQFLKVHFAARRGCAQKSIAVGAGVALGASAARGVGQPSWK